MKWIFICLIMLNVLYFSWNQFVEPKIRPVAELDTKTQVEARAQKHIRLVSEGRAYQ